MTINLSIKNVPDDLAARLRERAKRHHRSLQREMMVILEEATAPRRLTIADLRREVQALGLRTSAEAVTMLREDRDAR